MLALGFTVVAGARNPADVDVAGAHPVKLDVTSDADVKAAAKYVQDEFGGAAEKDGVLVNAICPGWVRSDMRGPVAPRSVEQGAGSVVWAVTIGDDGPTGGFFQDGKPLPW